MRPCRFTLYETVQARHTLMKWWKNNFFMHSKLVISKQKLTKQINAMTQLSYYQFVYNTD